MKLNKELIREMGEWVASNGLIEYGGATLKSFCEHFRINKETYYNWLEKSPFSTAIKNAREKFKANLSGRIVVSLAMKATGYDAPETQVRKVPSGKGMVVKERVETTKHVAPDTAAGIFLLTNLDPEHWKNRQQQEHSGSVGVNWTELLRDAKESRGGGGDGKTA